MATPKIEVAPERIAEAPLAERDASRMLLLDRRARSWEDGVFRELPDRVRGDELLVVNNKRVIPARLFGNRAGVGSEAPGRRGRRGFLEATIEVLLVRRLGPDRCEALVRPGRKVRTGERIFFDDGLEGEVVGRGAYGLRELRLISTGNLEEAIALSDRVVVRSAGPETRPIGEYAIDLPRPRLPDGPAVEALRKHLLDLYPGLLRGLGNEQNAEDAA